MITKTAEEIISMSPKDLYEMVVIQANCPVDTVGDGPTPLGMYHCPICRTMVLSGVAHPPIDEFLLAELRTMKPEQVFSPVRNS